MALWSGLPNTLTGLRLLLVPVVLLLLLQGALAWALSLFVLAGVSDWLDGFLARRWQLQSEWGAMLDPVADKAMMLAASVSLWSLGWIPWWLAWAIIGRDVLIVLGALAYHWHVGQLVMAPTRLGKFNTALEFLLLTTAMVDAWLGLGWWLHPAFYLLLLSIVISGGHYIWLWSGKALRHASRHS